MSCIVFFFNDTATTEIYTLSLHDALPISRLGKGARSAHRPDRVDGVQHGPGQRDARVAGDGAVVLREAKRDRKSTRLNSSHLVISYAVFCLKKKNHAVPT